jgi:hypothetical protein
MMQTSSGNRSLVLWKWIVSIGLFAAGVMLAENVGHSLSILFSAMTRNPLTIAVTTFLNERAPESLIRFEQDLLHFFSLAPYFGLGGVIAGILFKYRWAWLGVCVPLGFGLWFNVCLVDMSFSWKSLHWTDLLPDIVSIFALTPIYLIGVAAGHALRHRRFPSWSISDCFIATTLASVLCYAIIRRPFLLIPGTIFVTCSLLAWRLLRNIRQDGVAEAKIVARDET